MNSLILLLISLVCFVIGYIFYGRYLEKLWQTNACRPTPATTHFDGVDYVPARNILVLLGHHFSSIAGAGPIIGPTIAVCYWGWGPAIIWIILGSIFFGGIHDFGALMASIREGGTSIGDISARVLSPRAKAIFSIFLWLALILVIAVFAYLAADTFIQQPAVVLPSLGSIPLAILVGLALYRYRLNSIIVTVVALIVLGGLIFLGRNLPMPLFSSSSSWIILLLIYCFFASTLPVHILLQPRDYLSSFLLFGGILLAVIGIVISHPPMPKAAFVTYHSSLGYLWPIMFITVACGANSGFHSLIASGTTSKQLANEKHGRPIAFGGMLLEGFLAVLVIICVAGGMGRGEMQAHLAMKTSPVNMYGIGFGNLTTPFLGGWGKLIALMVLNAFILTTLDTATRITRYITEELLRIKNRYFSTFIVVLIAGFLALGRDSAQKPLWQKIWPIFGASNQLVAGLTLLVISCWLLSRKRNNSAAIWPAAFMLCTSMAALGLQLCDYWRNREFLLSGLSVFLLLTALVLVKEVVAIYKKTIKI